MSASSAAERRRSAHIPSSPPPSSAQQHAHTRSIGSALDLLNPAGTSSPGHSSSSAYGRGAPTSPLAMHASMVAGTSAGPSSQPMSPASSRGGRYTGGSVPMSPAGTGGWGNETQWSDIQARTFCKWLNTKLEAADLEPMTDLVKDFSSGVKLIELLEIMSGETFGKYTRKKNMHRVEKAENAARALQFIRDSGVKLTNIGPEDIVDGNLKLILGMIWTLILRFTIAGITEEGLSAKDGLLLWCQRKTQPYREVDVQNFKGSFADGLALCALIHRHRPELLDFDKLDKDDTRGNTELALSIAEKELGIPRLLEVKDLCDVPVPDERSVMTYVAEFFHRFSQEDKMETGARRIQNFADLVSSLLLWKTDFERRVEVLLCTLDQTRSSWTAAPTCTTYPEAIGAMNEFAAYKKTKKREWIKERQELGTLYSNIQTKSRTYGLQKWEPAPGMGLSDLEREWERFVKDEGVRSRAINATIRDIKEDLRKQFAKKAADLTDQLRRVEHQIGSLLGSLSDQKAALAKLALLPPKLRTYLETDIAAVHAKCQEAKIEENDYTVLTYDDLEYELELAEKAIRAKIGFVENQMVSAQHTNITPAKLEEFESTFKHFDKDDTNTLMLWEMHSALASLGIVYPDEELQDIYSDLEKQYGAVTFEAWLALLTEITKDDSSSADQLREAFRGIAGDKPYVTEIDFTQAQLPRETIKFLAGNMPVVQDAQAEGGLDYHAFLQETFGQ